MSVHSSSDQCPICDKYMTFAFSHDILNKYRINYNYCNNCGLIKSEFPYWLEEAYIQAISDMDTGIIARSISNSRHIEVIVNLLGLSGGRFVDIAGGYGILTRMLRDKGYECFSTDKYCQNLFAKYFEPTDNFTADALFAIEVLEHVENPFEFTRGIADQYCCKTIVISTLTYSGSIPVDNWWYYSFESGQHISFYQPKTLLQLACKMGCDYLMLSPGLHLITDKKIPLVNRIALTNRYFRKLTYLYLWAQRKELSKTWEDYLYIAGNKK